MSSVIRTNVISLIIFKNQSSRYELRLCHHQSYIQYALFTLSTEYKHVLCGKLET
jgi:hypothetical protein